MSIAEKTELEPIPEMPDPAAQAKMFLGKMKIFSDLSNEFSRSQIERQKSKGIRLQESHLYSYAFGGLYKCHLASCSQEEMSRVHKEYGDDVYQFMPLLDKSKEKFDKAGHIGKLNKRDRLITTVQTMLFCGDSNIPVANREELLRIMGYESKFLDNFVESAAWTAGFLLPVDGILVTSQAIPAAFGPHIQWSDPGAVEMVVAAYALDALFLGLNVYANRRDILNRHLQACPNVFATSAHMMVTKIFPDWKLRKELSIILPSIFPTIFSEIGFLSLLGLPDTGVSTTIFRHGLSILNQGAQMFVANDMYNRAEKEYIKN